MGIRVAYEPKAADIGNVALATGMTKAAQRDIENALKAQANAIRAMAVRQAAKTRQRELNYRKYSDKMKAYQDRYMEHRRDRRFRGELNYRASVEKQRDWRSFQTEQGREERWGEEMGYRKDIDTRRLEQTMTIEEMRATERDAEIQRKQLEQAEAERQELEKRRTWTPYQQQQRNKLINDMEAIRMAPDLSESERVETIQPLMEKLNKMRKSGDAPPTAQEQGESMMYVDEAGHRMIVTKTGLKDLDQGAEIEIAKYHALMAKIYADEVEDFIGEGGKTESRRRYTGEQAAAKAREDAKNVFPPRFFREPEAGPEQPREYDSQRLAELEVTIDQVREWKAKRQRFDTGQAAGQEAGPEQIIQQVMQDPEAFFEQIKGGLSKEEATRAKQVLQSGNPRAIAVLLQALGI